MRHIVFIVALWLGTLGAPVAAQRVLTLEQTIDLATDSASHVLIIRVPCHNSSN